MESAIVKELIKEGVLGLFLGIFIWLFIRQLKRAETLADKVFELGMAVAKADVEVKNVLGQVAKDLDGLREDVRALDP